MICHLLKIWVKIENFLGKCECLSGRLFDAKLNCQLVQECNSEEIQDCENFENCDAYVEEGDCYCGSDCESQECYLGSHGCETEVRESFMLYTDYFSN